MYIHGELSSYYPSIKFEDMSVYQPNALRNYVSNQIYALYDRLCEKYPNNVRRILLGYGEKEDGTDDVKAPIYEYVFTPPTTRNNVRGSVFTSPPKVLITTGVHGSEKSTVYTTYKMFEEMLKDEFNPLTPLRLNVEFRVIPIVNPTGFNLKTRHTASGIDANRNFTTSNNNEIRIVREWVQSHSNAILLLDIHNTWTDSFGLTYGISHQEPMRDIYTSVVRTLSFDWYNRYGIGHQNNFTEGYTMNGGAGHIYYEGQRMTNIGYSILLETAADDYNRIEYTSEVLERTYALTTNFLRAFFNWLNKEEV